MELTMTIPLLVLFGFAAWTILTLFGSIGVYRWSRILTGRASIAEWRADRPQGSEWYQRAMRAHMNCVENLPIYTAIVVALTAMDLQSSTIDRLAIAMLAARVSQTLTHIVLPSTNAATALRFAVFITQGVCRYYRNIERILKMRTMPKTDIVLHRRMSAFWRADMAIRKF
jgi:uncharacterized MAPEG superfamily protein